MCSRAANVSFSAGLEASGAAGACTLCPAGCELRLSEKGRDAWRVEYPQESGGGVCPRGSALGELLTHRGRILSPAVRRGGRLTEVDLKTAWREVLRALRGTGKPSGLTLMLDGNIPVEQMAEAAAWAGAWEGCGLCFVLEPADEQLLLGIEASGAEHLAAGDVAQCDGFLMIGDVFAANPTCARGVLDRHKADPKTPIVVIDSGAGKAFKFANRRVDSPPGAACDVLAAVAAGAGAPEKAPAAGEFPSAVVAGRALAACRRLGVLIAAEYGRSDCWRQIGHSAGLLAKAHGGAVGAQTAGLNALAAVRLAAKLGAISPAEALSRGGPMIVIGCDLLGMLGLTEAGVVAAAAPLPNRTTETAPVVLPTAMPGEYGGTYLFAGGECRTVAPLLPAPAGVPTPAELVAALASAAGVAKPRVVASPDPRERRAAEAPSPAPAWADVPSPALLFGRQASEAGCGALTSHASWQRALHPLPEARISPDDARRLHLEDLSVARITRGASVMEVRVRVAPELSPGRIVLPEGSAQARMLNPCVIQARTGTLAAVPVSASVSM